MNLGTSEPGCLLVMFAATMGALWLVERDEEDEDILFVY
jgi:hypothetical protein